MVDNKLFLYFTGYNWGEVVIILSQLQLPIITQLSSYCIYSNYILYSQ